MRGRDAGCGCTVIGYGHRRNNVAFQHSGAPVIAYRDATVQGTRARAQTISTLFFTTPRQT
jgi:hypothetical protein